VDFDNGLNATVNKVREALGDSAEHPRFIETLPRRGYRFIAVVDETSSLPRAINPESLAACTFDTDIPLHAQSHRKQWIIIAAAATLVVVAAIVWRFSRRDSRAVEAQLEQITTNATELSVTGSAISPDGKFLAYSDAAGTYLRVVSTGETHALPIPAGLELRPDAWLPDSANFIATHYARTGPGEEPSLWMVPVVGQPAQAAGQCLRRCGFA
jgi:hypothetical protein